MQQGAIKMKAMREKCNKELQTRKRYHKKKLQSKKTITQQEIVKKI
jgi:hypothetical protein